MTATKAATAKTASAPEPSPAPEPAPEPKPKWPPIWPALNREYSHLAKPLPDAFAGMMAFNGMTAAHEAAIAEDNKTLAVDAAILAEADQRHEEKRAGGRYVQQDVCSYAEWAELARCPVHGTLAEARAVRDASAAQEARALDEVAATLAGQHHEPGKHPWLDTMAHELSTADEPPAA